MCITNNQTHNKELYVEAHYQGTEISSPQPSSVEHHHEAQLNEQHTVALVLEECKDYSQKSSQRPINSYT
jgi:hypothetical protein